jgi:hypothetical protein
MATGCESCDVGKNAERPWERANRKRRTRRSRKLTPAEKTRARKAAEKAGRRYPNLVDNMRVAARSGKRQMKRIASSRAKDPRGGLTARGRAVFRKRDGSRLRPGVKKPEADMTPQDKKRKGSWAVRFYGRVGRLPPLKDNAGKPTRFALTAAAWGEPVPKSVAAARKIAAKGHRLLREYRRKVAAGRRATRAART